MSDKARIKIAAAVTAAFLAAMSAAGVIAHTSKSATAGANLSAAAAVVHQHNSGQSHFSQAWNEQDQHD